jgi:hypothetical protein
VKQLKAPRLSLVWGGLGTLLFLTLGTLEILSGAPAWRVTAYFVLATGAMYIVVRAVITILGKTRPGS